MFQHFLLFLCKNCQKMSLLGWKRHETIRKSTLLTYTKVSARLYSDCAIASSSQDTSPCSSLRKAANHLVLVDWSNVVAMNMENGQARQQLLLHRGTQVRLEATEGTDAALTGASCDWPCSEKLQKPGDGRTQRLRRGKKDLGETFIWGQVEEFGGPSCCPTLVFFVVQAADVSAVKTSISACRCLVDGRTCTTRRCVRVASGTARWNIAWLGAEGLRLIADYNWIRTCRWQASFFDRSLLLQQRLPQWTTVLQGVYVTSQETARASKMALFFLLHRDLNWSEWSYRMLRTRYGNCAAHDGLLVISISHQKSACSTFRILWTRAQFMWSTGKDSKWKRKKRVPRRLGQPTKFYVDGVAHQNIEISDSDFLHIVFVSLFGL